MKHVYILGAGFSVPLGGPLFSQLLTRDLDIYWRQIRFGPDQQPWRNVLTWLHDGQKFEQAFGRRLDAEQLLAQIDRFARRSDLPMAIQLFETVGAPSFPAGHPRPFFQTFDRILKQVLSIECDGFLEELEDESDLWDPYRQWFSGLGADDTIITFNYDTAIERLSSLCSRPYSREKLCLENRAEHNLPKLIKLHGSIDWFGTTSEVMFRHRAYEGDVDLLIGTPGLAKATMHYGGFFKDLMEAAMDAIRQANVVSIVGYSMPETDNRSRMAILKAIGEGYDEKRLINIVLGPQSGTTRALRMKAIIEPHVPPKDKCPVIDRPMYAQDFLPDVGKYVDSGPEGPLFLTSA